jgi:hypothetical protein
MRTASASARLLKPFSSLNHPTVPLATRPSLLPRVSSPRADILHTQMRLFDEWDAYELPRTPFLWKFTPARKSASGRSRTSRGEDRPEGRKQMFVAQGYPRSRISIHRCYKRSDRPAATPRYRAVFGRLGPWLCRILHVDFREYLFHVLR